MVTAGFMVTIMEVFIAITMVVTVAIMVEFTVRSVTMAVITIMVKEEIQFLMADVRDQVIFHQNGTVLCRLQVYRGENPLFHLTEEAPVHPI